MKSLWFLVQIVIFCEVPSWRTCVKVRQGSQHDTERQRGMHRVIIVPEQRNFLDPKFALAHSISVKPGCTCQFCEFCESKPAQIICLQHVLPAGTVLLLPPLPLMGVWGIKWLSGVSAAAGHRPQGLLICGSECGRKLTFLWSVKKAECCGYFIGLLWFSFQNWLIGKFEE